MSGKKMSKNVKKPEERYKILFEEMKDIVVFLDKKGRIIDINPAVKKITGFSPKEIKGHHFKELKFINSKSKRRIAEYFKKRLRGIEAPPYEIEGVNKNRKRLVTEVSAAPFIIDKGKIIGSLAILRDITERKKREEEIKSYQKKIESLINSSSDLIFLKDKNFRYLVANKAHEKPFNIKVKDIIGKTDFDFMPKTVAKGCRKSDIEAFKSGFISREEWLDEKCFHIVKQRVENAKGKVIGIAAVIRDITERKKMEKKLSESEERLRNIFSSSPDAITVTDLNGNIIECNRATLNMHGFSVKEELIGKRAFDLIAQKDWQRALKNMRKTLKQGSVKNIEYTFLTKDGREFPAELSASIIRDSSDKPMAFMAITKDISERKKADQAKTEFVSLTSHQLRTPLTTINWYSEMLLLGKAGKLYNQQKKYLEEIYTANQQLVKSVNALLNVSRIELGILGIKPEPINLTEIADSVLSGLSPQIKNKKLKVEKNYSKNLPIINADPNIMRIVFQNLLSNAVKYIPERGRVKLLIKKQKSDVLIKVLDTGYGIPKTQQSRIFTKFFRADNIREKEPDGTGLGLYIVKSVLEQSGGKIWLESEENKGTTFYATIPLEGMKKKKGKKRLNI
ncbi:PAS domain S-box protein [Patescibacteria group bacterium]|nr:PAS domain S-box protein [Patescibacteria group bacterium]